MPDPQNQSNTKSNDQLDSPNPASSPAAWTTVSRRLMTLAWITFVFLVTLLTFPGFLVILTCLITAVIGDCLGFQQMRRAAWISLVAGVILIAKTPSIQIEFVLLVVAFLITGIAYFFINPKLRWPVFIVAVAAVAFFGVKRTLDAQASQTITLDNQRPIVCLGDSLTEGKNGGYPAELQKLVAAPVLNYGRNGYTTQIAIDDLLPKIIQKQPQLVILELGGHDYNTGQPRDATKKRLRQIIQTLIDADVTVVIVEIPRGFVSDPFFGIERELAAEFDLQLIPDTIVRRFVFFSPIVPPGIWLDPKHHLSEDGLHPNQRGQVEFAKIVADAILP